MSELARDYRESNHELALSFGRYMLSRLRLSKATQQAYSSTVGELVDFFGSRTLVAASRADMHIFLERLLGRGLKATSTNRHVHALRCFFKFLRYVNLITRDPMLQISQRKVPGRSPRVLTVGEVEKLIAAAQNPFERAVCEVLYGTAIRVSELCALRLEDIDLPSNIVRIVQGKGGKDRYSLFGSHATKAILEYLEWRKPAKFLFELPRHSGQLVLSTLGRAWRAHVYVDGVQRSLRVGKRRDLPTEQDARAALGKITARLPGFHLGGGSPCKVRAIRKLIDRLGERAAIGHVHPHMLRRAAACHMHSDGAGIREIQVYLGHSSIKTTQLYTHLTIEDLQKPMKGATHMSKEIVLKKSEAREVVMPSADLLARLVNQRFDDLLLEAHAAELQPFFERREVRDAMLRSQTAIERHKWSWYFEDWGCLICERKDVRLVGVGMCQRCLSRTRERLSTSKRRRAPDVATQAFKDTVRLAREAVLPSLGTLARKRGGK